MSTWAEWALGLLGAGLVVLGRWLGHLYGRLNELRERVARLEGRTEDGGPECPK